MSLVPRHDILGAYWYFAAERQRIFFARIHNNNPPYSEDPIFQQYSFCNSYRASDRVSQFLLRHVIYASPDFTPQDTVFRILLFRLFNQPKTWEALTQKFGDLTYSLPFLTTIETFLDRYRTHNTLYHPAYILPPATQFGSRYKHKNHLALVRHVMETDLLTRILSSSSLESLYYTLLEIPSFGRFLAYQLATDLNYSEVFSFSENDFTVAGPGAQRGIQKCFRDISTHSMAYVIQSMVEQQEEMFDRYNLTFTSLWGRPLQAIDCQNLFCETDKYTRVSHPELNTKPSRIKRRFKAHRTPLPYFYPPKWDINDRINETL